MFHFVYKTTNKINGKYYIGVHNTNNINDGYLGSGKLLNLAISKYGRSNFTREILEYFDSKEEAFNREAELVTIDEVKNPNCYNITLGGFGNGNMLLNPTGMIVVNNGVRIKFIYPEELDSYINNGWTKGSLRRYSPYGKIMINNGIDMKFVSPTRLSYWIDNGWVKGKPHNLIWMNNGVENIMIHKDKVREYFDNGWIYGQIKKETFKKYWLIKDGKQIRVSFDELQLYMEDGWIIGRNTDWSSTLGKIRITKNGKYKYIERNEFSKYKSSGWTKSGSEMNGPNFTTKGTMWINNGKDTILIKRYELDKYPDWKIGTLNHSTKGRIKINNGIKEILIDPNDINKYPGWNRGRIKKELK